MRSRRTFLLPTARRLAAGPCKKAGVHVGALVLLIALLAGCGGGDAPVSGAAPSTVAGVGTVTVAPDGVQEVTLQTQDDYVFTPDAGAAPIDASIPLLAPGERKTIDFDVETAGDYPFQCSFHVQLGQVGTMTVRS